MSSPGTVTSTGPAAASAPRPRDRRDLRLGTGSNGVSPLPLAGQPGHGSTATNGSRGKGPAGHSGVREETR
jgi:hypothetical protein